MHIYTINVEVFGKTKALAVASGKRIARKIDVQTTAELRRPEVKLDNVAFNISTCCYPFPPMPPYTPSSLPAPGSYSTRRTAAGCSGKSEESTSKESSR